MKYLVLFFYLLVRSLSSFSQNDTLIFPVGSSKIMDFYCQKLSQVDGYFYIDETLVDKDYFISRKELKDILRSKANTKYCKFYIEGVLSEEGNFWLGTFVGSYKQYYPNGNLKMEGNFSNNYLKIGEWKYYKSNGKLKKVKIYKKEKKGRNVQTNTHEWFAKKVKKINESKE